MAFENYPEAEKKQQPVPEDPKKNSMRGVFTAVLILALLGTWGYIIWDKNKTKETISQKDNAIAATSTERDDLKKELDDATMRYDMLKTSNSKKDSTISAKDREIDQKKSRIQSLLTKANATAEELKEAKDLIASLNEDIDSYKKQVEELRGENVVLTQEKAVVTEQRDKVKKDLDSSMSVIKQKEDLIDVGSTLHASNFSITGINEKNNGKEKETSTAKRVDKLRITFDLDENMIAQSGAKELYVIITSPDGTPIAVDALGSGKFNTRDGQEKVFTQKVDINYVQNKKQTVSFDWKQNSNFATGNYKIEVYNNGFKIGEAYRPLKKGGLFN